MKEYFESVLSADKSPIVICNLEHTVIYMNPASIKEYGNITGSSIFNCHNEKSNKMIVKVFEWFNKSQNNNCVHTFYNQKQNKDVYMIALRDANHKLIGYYEKHEFRTLDNSPFYDF